MPMVARSRSPPIPIACSCAREPAVCIDRRLRSSLRAQRSNPENQELDCFVARAPRNDGCDGLNKTGAAVTHAPNTTEFPCALKSNAS
ncbi:hypothetical protein RPMA_14055 [Tardiphaga alba]|uniref:Uncharacterized protein n=1 Tax=Tardiphaga alba TaxID=340268 RepID=A0ABX8A847_9BRAD|nr:hypothetical protein RPMA_14055 [Tardiphaga alba]